MNPHLSFNGQCEAAFKLYEECLGGKVAMLMTYGDAPLREQVPAEWRKKVLHGTFTYGAHRLTGADVLPEQYQKPQGFSVLLDVGTVAEADRIFKALAEGGSVQYPIEETFWAARFG